MKKNILFRFFSGFSFGVAIGEIVNLCCSAAFGTGEYSPVMPQLASHFSTQLAAVAVQFLLVGLIGAVFAEGGLVFLIEKWSALKQFVIHFFVTAVFYLPFVYLCWTPQNPRAFFMLILNVLFTYALTYYIQYRVSKRTVDKINQKLNGGVPDGSDTDRKAL